MNGTLVLLRATFLAACLVFGIAAGAVVALPASARFALALTWATFALLIVTWLWAAVEDRETQRRLNEQRRLRIFGAPDGDD